MNSPAPINMQNEENTNYAGISELWANEQALIKYNSDIVSKLSWHAPGARNVLEFGAGIGTLAQIWHAKHQVRPECLEIDASMREVLDEREFKSYASLEAVTSQYDLIYTSNVLEHIEEDVATLKALRSKLKIEGVLAIYVPAFMVLYSNFDSALGHFRRYERAELRGKLEMAGYDIIECTYADSVGFFAWLAVKLRGQKSVENGGGNKSLEIYDRYIFPVSKFLDGIGLRHVFGKNLLVIARKRGTF